MEELEKLEIKDIDFRLKVNLERYTTIKLAGMGNIAICKTEQALKKLILELKKLKYTYHLVGWGANQVLLNSDKTLFIKLDFYFDSDSMTLESADFEIPASVSLNALISIASKLGLGGWNVFTGIPASLGGAICMNAGTALGEIGNLVKSVRIMKPNGEIFEYNCSLDSFSYRTNNFLNKGEIIISAKMIYKGIDKDIGSKISEYLEYRKKTQPLTTRNCGSVFKNLEDFKAGALIESIGLKGFGSKNISVSRKHANFIENTGNGTAKEFSEIISCLEEEIERYSGLKFELEVKVY